jgi:hypothetical protein
LFIDRVTHQTYIAAVAAAVLAGVTPPADPDPYSEPLADAHSELQSAFDEHISRNHWHIVHAGAGAVALNAAQAVKIADSLATCMKDCNSYLTNALCQALAAPDMAAYYYLTYLDFVKDASGYKTNFGRIPPLKPKSVFRMCSSSQNWQRKFSRSDAFSVPPLTITMLSLCLLTSTLASYATVAPSKLILGLMLQPLTISLQQRKFWIG